MGNFKELMAALHLRYMARQVQDSAQLDAILDDVTDPHMRLAVKRLLIPLVKFTYTEPCRCPDTPSAHATVPPICKTCHKEQR